MQFTIRPFHLHFSIAAAAALISLPCLVPAVAQQAFFMGLGDLPGGDFSSVAMDISADGSIVVGLSQTSPVSPMPFNDSFRWTRLTGMIGLGPSGSANVVSVSDDGSTIVGGSGSGAPFRHAQESGYSLLPLGSFSNAQAHGISGNGSVIVGLSGASGIRWIDGVGPEILPQSAQAQDISADGQTILGFGLGSDGVSSDKFVWRADTGIVRVPEPEEGSFGFARRISSGGTVVVGDGDFDGETRAVRWSAETGTVQLGQFQDGTAPRSALGVNADGSVIVGGSAGAAAIARAFIWDADLGSRDVQQLLIEDYGLGVSLAGWDFTRSAAWGVSADGRTIAGHALNPAGNREAWIAFLGTPVPEPSTLALAASMLAALSFRRDGRSGSGRRAFFHRRVRPRAKYSCAGRACSSATRLPVPPPAKSRVPIRLRHLFSAAFPNLRNQQ